jgi:hypothetical protein
MIDEHTEAPETSTAAPSEPVATSRFRAAAKWLWIATKWVSNAAKWLWTAAKRFWNGGPLDDDFASIERLLTLRTDTLDHAIGKLRAVAPNAFKDKDDSVLFRLAAVDLFVEKAQAVLTARARRMSRAGIVVSGVAVVALVALSVYIAFHANNSPQNLDRNQLILQIVSAVSLGAIVLVAVKYMVALARSFFHESVTLLSRRHALRFGRMYLYLNHDDVDLKNLRKAFDWNRGGDSSFLDIKPGEIGQTPYSVLATSIADAIEKATEKATEKVQKARQKGGANNEEADALGP